MGLCTALVLGGGGARGAYEAGVFSWLRDTFEPGLGRALRVDVLSGTSIGAVNACFLAGTLHRPRDQARELVDHWRSLRIENVLHLRAGDVWRLAREAMGGTPSVAKHLRGGLVDPVRLANGVLREIDWHSLHRNLRDGLLRALSLAATHVASGRTTVFVERTEPGLPPWSRDPAVEAVRARIGTKHALASAAIPLLFPAVTVGGRLYADGGLRQNVPFAPALRLGAERVAVVSLRRTDGGAEAGPVPEPSHEAMHVNLPYLLGKMLNACLLDRTGHDLDRLRRLNAILDAGTRAYGPSFARTLSEALAPGRGRPVRYVRNLLVRPSEDIGRLAAAYVRSPAFSKTNSLARSLVRRVADGSGSDEADLAAYLLFDGGFADQLVELGRRDAAARADEWVRFWSEQPECDAEAAQIEADRSAA